MSTPPSKLSDTRLEYVFKVVASQYVKNKGEFIKNLRKLGPEYTNEVVDKVNRNWRYYKWTLNMGEIVSKKAALTSNVGMHVRYSEFLRDIKGESHWDWELAGRRVGVEHAVKKAIKDHVITQQEVDFAKVSAELQWDE